MNQYNSFYAGIVTDNKDPKKLGRVKIMVPALATDFSLEWAMPAANTGGPGSGRFEPPAIDSGVFVAFMEGDPETPLYFGGFWAEPDGQAETPTEFQREDPTNRGYKSPGGHLIEYDDGENKGIRHTTSGGFKAWLDEAGDQILLETPGGVIVKLDNTGKEVSITAENKVELITKEELHTVEKFTVTASDKVDIKGMAGTDLGDAGSMTMVKGTQVLIAGGGLAVAVVGGKAIGAGNLSGPVITTVIQGSSKVFAPL